MPLHVYIRVAMVPAMRLLAILNAMNPVPKMNRRQAGNLQGHGIASQTRITKLSLGSPGDHPRWHSSFLHILAL